MQQTMTAAPQWFMADEAVAAFAASRGMDPAAVWEASSEQERAEFERVMRPQAQRQPLSVVPDRQPTAVAPEVPAPVVDANTARRAADEAEARARAEAREQSRRERFGPRPETVQTVPDRFTAEAQQRSGIIPRAVGAAVEGVRGALDATTGAYVSGLDKMGRAGESAAGAGLSVLGMPETGAALQRGAAEPAPWAAPVQAEPTAAAVERGAAQAPRAPGRDAPAAVPEAPSAEVSPPWRPGAMSRPTPEAQQQIAAATTRAAPVTGEAMAPAAQALSAASAVGARPNETQAQAAARAAHERFVTVAGPRHYQRLIEQGRVAEAYQWKAFYESKDTEKQVNHFSRAVFATSMGDAQTAIREVTAAVAGSDIGDTYEIVPGESAFLPENDDLFARFTFRNKQTGEKFVQSFPSVEDFVSGMASVASAEATFERAQATIRERVNEIIKRQGDDNAAVLEIAFELMKGNQKNFGMPGAEKMTEAEAVASARALVEGSRRAGLGTLGVSQGGTRDPRVPAMASPR